MDVLAEYKAALAEAHRRAKSVLKPGDRVSRNMCGGAKGTFVFTGWEGAWACGKTVTDCPSSAIYAINGRPVKFFDWDGDIGEVARLQREARASRQVMHGQ